MIVLDNSMLMAALLADERHPLALEIYAMVLDGEKQAVVPPIFLYEACNSVLQALRRKRIDEKMSQDYLSDIYAFPLHVDKYQNIEIVVALAVKHRLTVYDAAYLELCKRESAPLATLDGALIIAAKKEKILTLVE